MINFSLFCELEQLAFFQRLGNVFLSLQFLNMTESCFTKVVITQFQHSYGNLIMSIDLVNIRCRKKNNSIYKKLKKYRD